MSKNRRTGGATIVDVAQAAGVSPASVSLALNGKGRLSQATRERIIAAATSLSYVPDPNARALRTGTTRVLGLSFGMPVGGTETPADFHIYRQVLSEAMRSWLPLSYGLLVLPPAQPAGAWRAHSIDGALVVNPLRDEGPLSAMRHAGTPFVALGRPFDAGVGESWVESDRNGGVRMALDRLAEAGDGPVALVTQAGWATTHLDDVRGAFAKWCHDRSQPPHEFLVQGPVVADTTERITDWLAGVGARGILASHWELGQGLTRALREAGITLPDELEVIAWGDPDPLSPEAHEISTVVTGVPTLVQRATEALLDLMAGGAPTQLTTPVHFLQGTTSRRPEQVDDVS